MKLFLGGGSFLVLPKNLWKSHTGFAVTAERPVEPQYIRTGSVQCCRNPVSSSGRQKKTLKVLNMYVVILTNYIF